MKLSEKSFTQYGKKSENNNFSGQVLLLLREMWAKSLRSQNSQKWATLKYGNQNPAKNGQA